ncbi:MAG: hypothetical protein ACTH2Q_16660 [Propionibacteriaceae bacterium]
MAVAHARRDFFALSDGEPYRTAIEESALRVRFADTAVPLDDVLDRLERKEVIAKRRGDRLIPVL